MHKLVTMGSFITRHDSGANHLEGKPGINIPNPKYQSAMDLLVQTGVKIIIKGKNVRKAVLILYKIPLHYTVAPGPWFCCVNKKRINLANS